MIQADHAVSPELNPLSLFMKTGDETVGVRGSLDGVGDLIPEQRASIIDESAIVRYYKDATRKPIIISDGHQGNAKIDEDLKDDSSSFDVRLSLDVTTGCGGKIWPAAEVLGQYIASRRSEAEWKDKVAVELGAGTGLVGLLAAEATQLNQVWITDQIPMMALMHRNLSLNSHLNDRCLVAELNWGEKIGENLPKWPDVLLLADCVYLEVAFQPLVDIMKNLSTKDTEILFCYQQRRKADKRFFKLLRKHFTFHDIEDDDPIRRQEYNRQGTKLLRVCKIRD